MSQKDHYAHAQGPEGTPRDGSAETQPVARNLEPACALMALDHENKKLTRVYNENKTGSYAVYPRDAIK